MKRRISQWAAAIGCVLSFVVLGTACDGDDLVEFGNALKGHQHRLEFMAAKESTCTERGNIDHWYCSGFNCYKLFSDEKGKNEITDVYFPKIPHTIEHHEKIESTCTSRGTMEYYECTACGTKFKDEQGKNELNLNDLSLWLAPHTIAHQEEQKPTCTEEGEKAHYYCEVCKKKFSDEKGHLVATDTDLAIAPAHDAASYWSYNELQHWHEYYCEHAGTEPKEDHNFQNNECKTCLYHKPSEGLTYEINDDGETASLTSRGSCTNSAIYVASTYEGKPVTEIADDVFRYSNIKSISLPQSLKKIGANAFRGCDLTQITLPSATTEIGDYAFYLCEKLTRVHVSGPSISIGAHAFDTCQKLTTFNGLSGAKEIGDYAFYGCDGLTSLSLSASSVTVGNYAFANCGGITSLTVKNAKGIGNQAFYKCVNLKSVEIKDKIVLSTAVSYEIGDEAFSSCELLESVTIGKGVKAIGNGAFYGCAKLATCTIGKNSVLKTIGDNAFNGCAALEKFILPRGLESIGERAFYGCAALKRIDIPNTVTTIKSNAFANMNAKLYPEVTRTPDGWANDWKYGNATYWGDYVDQEA